MFIFLSYFSLISIYQHSIDDPQKVNKISKLWHSLATDYRIEGIKVALAASKDKISEIEGPGFLNQFGMWIYNKQSQMQFPSKTQLIEDNSHSSEWNGDIFGVKKEDQFLGKVYRQAQEVTEANEPLPQGQWRANQFIEDNSFNGSEDSLVFQHLTSFEENIMESHGKKMKETFEKFLQSVNSRFCPEENHKNQKKRAKIFDEEEFEQAIFAVSNLNQETKKSLLRQSKKSMEAQHIIKNLLEELSEEHLVQALTICESIISEHEAANIFALDEDQIQAYITKHQIESTKLIRGKLADSWMVSRNNEDQKDFLKLIGSWMRTVFYALNGVYVDDNESCSTPKADACQKPRKMVKLE